MNGDVQENNLCTTLLEFGAPLIGTPDERMPLDVTKDALTFVIAVWNAHAMALPAWDHPEHLEHLTTMLETPEASELRTLFETLSAARQERYRLDARVVGEWELLDGEDGQRRLRCELRMPEPRITPETTSDDDSPQEDASGNV